MKYFLIILVVGAFLLRIYKGPELFFWNVDEDIIALTVKRILVDHRPQLIGFPIPGGIYLGPLFYYIVSIPYFFARMNPLHLYIFSAILGVISTFLVYKVGKIIFENEILGIISAIIFGFSYLANIYARVLSGLTFAPILSLLTYLILYQNLKLKKPKNLLWLAVILLIAVQNEGSSISLVVLTALIFIIYKLTFPLKKLYLIIGLFLIFHLPLLIFDLRHNFFLTKSFLNFFSGDNFGGLLNFNSLTTINALEIFPRTLSRFLLISGPNDVSSQILPCEDLVFARSSSISGPMFISAVFVIGFFVICQVFKKEKSFGQKIIFAHLLLMVVGIIIYNLFLVGYAFEWTTVIFFPGFAFITAYLLFEIYSKKVFGKIFVVLILAVFAILNTRSMINSSDKFSLSSKAEAVQFSLSQVDGRDFYLESLGSCFGQGYLYLFWYFGQEPKHAEGLIYDTAFFESIKKPELGVVMVHHIKVTDDDFEKYISYKNQAVSSKKIGEIEVLIIDGVDDRSSLE